MPAGLGADSAMLVHRRVSFALVSALLARQHARVKLRVHEVVRRFRLPHEETCSCRADIRTIEIRANATPQRANIRRFAQAGVGA